jgi:hypothetical protein
VRTVRAATTRLIRRGGPTAVRAVPRIARSVRRTAVAWRTPLTALARVLASTARRVAQRNPQLRQQLTRPLPGGRRVLARTGAAVRSGASPARLVAAAAGRAGPAMGLGGAAARYLGGGGRRIVTAGPVTIIVRPSWYRGQGSEGSR